MTLKCKVYAHKYSSTFNSSLEISNKVVYKTSVIADYQIVENKFCN